MIKKFILSQARANTELAVELDIENLRQMAISGAQAKNTMEYKSRELRREFHLFTANVFLAFIGESIESIDKTAK